MRRLGFALLASTALVGSAAAADLPVKMYTKAPVAPAPYNWTGFYVGLNGGGSWGKQDNALATIAGATLLTNSAKLNGVVGGGQIGYNWQFNQVVLGLEADLDASGQKGDGDPLFAFAVGNLFNAGGAAATHAYTDKLDWFGTVRGRLGWAMDRWLPYMTGGWAYGHGAISGITITTIPTTTTFSASQNYNGWTVGAGLEWAFMNNWSVKAEYLYINLGNGPTVAVSPALNIVSGRMTDNIGRVGVNYKF
jgi:outer membrane immunogenic protein